MEIKKLTKEELKKYGEIQIHCICGEAYFSPRDQAPKCQKCGHVWNLRPQNRPVENYRYFDKLGGN